MQDAVVHLQAFLTVRSINMRIILYLAAISLTAISSSRIITHLAGYGYQYQILALPYYHLRLSSHSRSLSISLVSAFADRSNTIPVASSLHYVGSLSAIPMHNVNVLEVQRMQMYIDNGFKRTIGSHQVPCYLMIK